MNGATIATLVFSSVTFFSTMAGGIAALRWPGRRQVLMALAGGVVLGAAFFDLLPDAVSRASELGMQPVVPLGAALAGYLAFRVMEHSAGHHEKGGGTAGLVGAGGFVVHSFFDGLAIGLGFEVSMSVGVLVALAVIGHDFSDGLDTVSYMVAHGQPVKRSVGMLLADALTPLVGAVVAMVLPVPGVVFPVAIGFFSGLFIFAATGRLLPLAAPLGFRRSTLLALGGVLFMFLISRLA
ncbi:MAG: ZIP family metal transporter [Rubrobacteraceae bacterium]|nr:ZIP family metal transporter [Rubrobacteraceae bacterium]